MKRIYLVKKDPNAPSCGDNWIQMNGWEFIAFLRTPEGQRRAGNFGQLDGCGTDDVIIIAECGDRTARAWRALRDGSGYQRKLQERMGIAFCSLEEEIEEDLTIMDTIADPGSDMEEELIRRQTAEALREALESLSDAERDLIYCLFLNEERMTEAEYGRRIGVTQGYVNRQKQKILAKLRSRIEQGPGSAGKKSK